MPFVYAFDHKHRKAAHGAQGSARGQGRQPGRDDLGAGAAGAAGLHHHHRRLPGLHGRRVAGRACRHEVARHVRRLEKAMGKRLGDASDPLLVSVRSGAKFSMPGMMDTVLNLGLNDASVKGLADQTSDERFAYDSYRRFISMYGRIVLGIDGDRFDEPFRSRPRRRPALQSDAEIPAGALRDLCQTYKRVVENATGPSLSPGAGRSAHRRHRGGVQVVERRPGRGLPGARAHPPRPRHRRQRADHGVRQPRRQLRHRRRLHPGPGHRRAGRVRRLPRQRPGRGRGRRHPQHRCPWRRSRTASRRSSRS